MDKKIIILAVVIFAVFVFAVFQFVLPRFAADNENGDETQISNEDVSSVLDEAQVGEEWESILGTTISLDRNRVDKIINDNAFWIAPLGGGRNMIVVSDNSGVVQDNIVSIIGEVRKIAEYREDALNWELNNDDLELIRQNPIVIHAASIEILN